MMGGRGCVVARKKQILLLRGDKLYKTVIKRGLST
jgi:hypothetical protein